VPAHVPAIEVPAEGLSIFLRFPVGLLLLFAVDEGGGGGGGTLLPDERGGGAGAGGGAVTGLGVNSTFNKTI
jgi:hypothetical protein